LRIIIHINVFKSYELSRRFNINAEEMLAQDLVNELTSEISKALVIEATTNVESSVEWIKTAPQGVGYMEHLLSLTVKLAEAENKILDQSGRLGTNLVYLIGTEAAALFKTLTGFQAVGDIKATLGTHLYGTYEGRPVVRSLDVAANEIVLISKGDDMFNAALFYLPYMPLFVTSTMEGQDHNPLKSQKAAAAMAGIKTVAPALMSKIVITA
jgi:hypothetical protein